MVDRALDYLVLRPCSCEINSMKPGITTTDLIVRDDPTLSSCQRLLERETTLWIEVALSKSLYGFWVGGA